jgi:hypothetical protein
VGLGNVNNTSDASKPVSTAQQAALDLKADATALTTETNARIDADNRREFAGGVALASAGNNLLTSEISFQNQNAFTFSGNFIFNLGAGNGIFGIHSDSNTGFSSNMLIRVSASDTEISFRYYNTLSNFRQAIVSHSHGGNLTNLFILFDGTSAPEIYVNGVSKTVTESTSGSTPPAWSDAISGNYFIFGQAYSNDNRAKTVSNFAIFNTALTATQAAELYQQGLQPWLAANPEYRRGGVSPIENTNRNEEFNDGTNDNWIARGDGNNTSIVDDNYNRISLFNNSANSGNAIIVDTIESDYKYYVSVDVHSLSGGIANVRLMNNNNSSSTNYAINTTGLHEFVLTANADTNSFEINNTNASQTIVLNYFRVTQLGSLATLPLDDDCRQLKDISGNRNDATASATGVTHLKQKDLHSFRDDNADGTGGSYLIANADILAENEVITGVTVDGRFYAASGAQDLTKRRIKLQDHGSHVDVKRSNGTTDDAAIAVTNPSDGTDFAISVLTQRI